ncbi:MAG TPA: hypothetical protein VEC36_05655, partial [Patescibacteria group bacterium]|nr:hypothetical protein [Patescibacteria group bacterium]
NNRMAVLMMDKKPRLYPLHDIGMEKFLKEFHGELLVGARGNVSEFTLANVLKERNISVLKGDSPVFDKIVSEVIQSSSFKDKKQIIELE